MTGHETITQDRAPAGRRNQCVTFTVVSATSARLLTGGGAVSTATVPHVRRDSSMDKWRIAKNSTIIRIIASTGTLVAVAALAGAGWKWV